jgi:hypothetical protein
MESSYYGLIPIAVILAEMDVAMRMQFSPRALAVRVVMARRKEVGRTPQ